LLKKLILVCFPLFSSSLFPLFFLVTLALPQKTVAVFCTLKFYTDFILHLTSSHDHTTDFAIICCYKNFIVSV
jgi:hypothetical protein